MSKTSSTAGERSASKGQPASEDIRADQEPIGTQPSDSTEEQVRGVVRVRMEVRLHDEFRGIVDPSIVAPEIYNNFGFSDFLRDRIDGKLTIGVTSAGAAEGKSMVASNLAVAIALASQRDVVCVDVNIARPRLHQVFGLPNEPGLLDALDSSLVHVYKSSVRNLAVLPVGDASRHSLSMIRLTTGAAEAEEPRSALGLDRLLEFRRILFSLKETFDVVIVDLPPATDATIPPVFLNQLDGVIVVVAENKTRKEDIDRVMAHLKEDLVIGFVYNRASRSM